MLALWEVTTGILHGKLSSPKLEGYKGWRWGICSVGDCYFGLKFKTNITVWWLITLQVFKITGLTIFEVQPYNFPCRESSSMDRPWPSHSWELYFLTRRVGTDFSPLETWTHEPGDVQAVITGSGGGVEPWARMTSWHTKSLQEAKQRSHLNTTTFESVFAPPPCSD